DEGLLIDRVRNRSPEAEVPEGRIGRAELRRVPRRLARVAVQRELVEAALLSLEGYDALRRLEAFEGRRGNVVRGVDLALFQGEHHRVGVREEPEDDLVDRGLAAPVARVCL